MTCQSRQSEQLAGMVMAGARGLGGTRSSRRRVGARRPSLVDKKKTSPSRRGTGLSSLQGYFLVPFTQDNYLLKRQTTMGCGTSGGFLFLFFVKSQEWKDLGLSEPQFWQPQGLCNIETGIYMQLNLSSFPPVLTNKQLRTTGCILFIKPLK